MANSDGTSDTDGTTTRRGGVPLMPLVVLVLVAVAGFSAAYFLTGGDGDGDAAAPATGDAAETSGDDETDAGTAEPESGYDIDVEPDPDPPRVEGTTLIVTVTDGGEPVTGATVRAAMEMDRHAHDGVAGEGEETEPGRYEVPVKFVMRGRWSGSVRVTVDDGPEASESVSYEVQ